MVCSSPTLRFQLINAIRIGDFDFFNRLVYTATCKHAEAFAEALREHGIKAAYYHAGMRASERERVQEQFMNDEIAVIVATTAFLSPRWRPKPLGKSKGRDKGAQGDAFCRRSQNAKAASTCPIVTTLFAL